jgi:pimeloyl-ACP methyl ester carboxylesterase
MTIDKGHRLAVAAGVILWMAVLMAGCASPLLQYQLASPAAALVPIGTPPVRDGRVRFREIFCQLLQNETGNGAEPLACERFLLRLGDEPQPSSPPGFLPVYQRSLSILMVPGALGECFGADALPYPKAVERLRAIGYRIEYINVGGRSGTEHNAARIADTVQAVQLGAGEKLVLVGYSKGTVDILHFLATYPDLASKVTAVASVSGAINGSPLADRYEGLYDFFISKFPFSNCGVGDGRLIESLKRAESMLRLVELLPPSNVRYYSLGSFTEPRDIARVMRIVGYPDLTRADPRNDGQTLYYDQIIPGSVFLGYANADHWAVAIPMEEARPFFTGHGGSNAPYPRAVLFEALVLYLEEQLDDTP